MATRSNLCRLCDLFWGNSEKRIERDLSLRAWRGDAELEAADQAVLNAVDVLNHLLLEQIALEIVHDLTHRQQLPPIVQLLDLQRRNLGAN